MHRDEERRAWARFQAGDAEALAWIYQRFRPLLFTYGRVFNTNRQTLEDAIQNLFVKLWLRRGGLADTDAVKPYLLACLRHELVRLIQKQARYCPLDAESPGTPFESDPEARWIELERDTARQHRVNDALQRASKRQREALELRYGRGFSLAQIAARMDIDPQSVANLLFRGLQKLRNERPSREEVGLYAPDST